MWHRTRAAGTLSPDTTGTECTRYRSKQGARENQIINFHLCLLTLKTLIPGEGELGAEVVWAGRHSYIFFLCHFRNLRSTLNPQLASSWPPQIDITLYFLLSSKLCLSPHVSFTCLLLMQWASGREETPNLTGDILDLQKWSDSFHYIWKVSA